MLRRTEIRKLQSIKSCSTSEPEFSHKEAQKLKNQVATAPCTDPIQDQFPGLRQSLKKKYVAISTIVNRLKWEHCQVQHRVTIVALSPA
jgi:hypothetical protein